jgi:hypothetical protein
VLDVMVNAYNPSTQEAHEVEASLDPISKKKKDIILSAIRHMD